MKSRIGTSKTIPRLFFFPLFIHLMGVVVVTFSATAFAADSDGDSVDDSLDNCPVLANANQLNTDGDGQGDVCDPAPLQVAISAGSAAGEYHTCTLNTAGGVQCWGWNYYGQLGDGTQTSRYTPVTVSGLENGVTAIVAGDHHSCALTTGGGVQCWGQNPYGQLGDGTTIGRLIPVGVSGLASNVTAITAGKNHTCALTTAAGLLCWGSNVSGKLGDGTTINRLLPVSVTGLGGGVTAIAAGGDHTCALITGGGVQCWGSNIYGQLGDSTTTSRYSPVTVSGLSSGVAAIAAGGDHTCALGTGGAVKCWGQNPYGQLGDGTTANRTSPVSVSGLPSGVVAIGAGARHVCAVTAGGGAQCWGYNAYGELGDGTTTSRFTPVTVSGLNGVVEAVEVGGFHTCVLTSGGGIQCWGKNDAGQLGDGTTENQYSPVMVYGLPGDSDGDGIGDNIDPDADRDMDGVLNGVDNCIATSNPDQLNTDGDAQGNVCDSDDDNDGEPDTSDKYPLNPAASFDSDNDGYPGSWNAGCDTACQTGSTLVLDNCPFTTNTDQLNTDGDAQGNACDTDDDNDVVQDSMDNCALNVNTNQTDTDGDGQGDVCDQAPLKVEKATAISTSGFHTCVIISGAGVQCWGNNNDGQLGDGSTTNRLMPVPVSGLTSGVVAIAAGASHTCALVSGGGVRCWGNNYDGQLGDSTTTNRLTPVAVSGLSSGVTAIAAGQYHTCALMTDGSLKCWGSNDYGLLGNGTITQSSAPVSLSALGNNVAAIAAGKNHNCILTKAASVQCWGRNYEGQLGDGITTSWSLIPVAVSGLASGVASIDASEYHSCALDVGGGMQCWGQNYYGELGDGTATKRSTPVGVSGLASDVAAIVTGGGHTCAMTTGGGMQCWGHNGGGQLGDGTITNRLTPVAVSELNSSVAAIAAGSGHTCALTTSGGVKCWGHNGHGQLGDGTESQRVRPVLVYGLPGDGDEDGIGDNVDAFPQDKNETVDTDNDGTGNNTDLNDDDDGVPDYIDAEPLNSSNNSERSLLLNAPYKGSAINEHTTVE